MKRYFLIFMILLAISNAMAQSHVSDLVVTPAFSGGTIKWYNSSTGGTQYTTPATTALVNGTTYFASQTVNGVESATRLAVTATVNPLPTPVITGSGTVCAGVTGSVYSVTSVDGHTYNWNVSGSSATTGLSTNQITVTWGSAGAGTVDITETITATSCAVAATQKAVTIKDHTVSPVITSIITEATTVVTGTSSEANGTSIELFNGSTSLGTTTVSSGAWTKTIATPATGDVITAIATATGKCVSTASTGKTIPAKPTATPVQSKCSYSTLVEIVTNPAQNGTNIKVYSASSGGTHLNLGSGFVNATTYYASQVVDGIESTVREDVLLTSMGRPATLSATTPQHFCSGATFTNLTTSNGTGTIRWYDAASGENYMNPATTMVSGTYYATQTDNNGCISLISTGVVVTIDATTAAPIVNSPICREATTVSGTSESGASVEVYVNGTLTTTVTASGTAWTATTSALSPTDVITAKAALSGKCQSAASDAVVVKYITATPVVSSPISIGATSVSGTCESGASVDVFVDGTYKTTVTANGTVWTATVTALPALQVVTAKATASGGGCISLVSNSVTVLAIGDAYQGGKVAYILQSLDPGYVAGQTHGFIAASADQSTGIIWALPAFQSQWVPSDTFEDLGAGEANTDKIIAQNGAASTYAAGLAKAYNGGGYNDWYLPSLEELVKLMNSRGVIGNFPYTVEMYWSSSEAATTWGHFYYCNGSFANNRSYTSKGDTRPRVRAVRSF